MPTKNVYKSSNRILNLIKRSDPILFKDTPEPPFGKHLNTTDQLGWEVGNKFREKTPTYGGIAGSIGGGLLGAGLGAGAHWLYNQFSGDDDEGEQKKKQRPGVGMGAMLGGLAGAGLGAYGGHQLGQHVWNKTQFPIEANKWISGAKNIGNSFAPVVDQFKQNLGPAMKLKSLKDEAQKLIPTIPNFNIPGFTTPTSTKASSYQQPPHYQLQDNPTSGQNCASCKNYSPDNQMCNKYGTQVQPHGVCEAFEEIQLNTDKLSEDKRKRVRSARPDRLKELNEQIHNVQKHPEAVFGTVMAPAKAFFGEDADKLTAKEAMKAGFILNCIKNNMSLDDMYNLLEKKAITDPGALAGKAVGIAGNVFSGLANRAIDWGGTLALGTPVVAGGLLGYGAYAAKKSKLDPDDIKHEQLQKEYLRLADEAKRKSKIKQLQDEDPTSVVQLLNGSGNA